MKTVLITGAGIGIGRATAKMFGTHGWRVIVTDVLEDEGAVVAAEINASGGTAEFHTLDVTSTAAAEAVLASVHANHGPLAALVCNAGIAHKVPLEELTDEKWDHTFEIDLKGMIRVIRPAVAQMKPAGISMCITLLPNLGSLGLCGALALNWRAATSASTVWHPATSGRHKRCPRCIPLAQKALRKRRISSPQDASVNPKTSPMLSISSSLTQLAT